MWRDVTQWCGKLCQQRTYRYLRFCICDFHSSAVLFGTLQYMYKHVQVQMSLRIIWCVVSTKSSLRKVNSIRLGENATERSDAELALSQMMFIFIGLLLNIVLLASKTCVCLRNMDDDDMQETHKFAASSTGAYSSTSTQFQTIRSLFRSYLYFLRTCWCGN